MNKTAEKVAKLWAAGLSCEQIAERMGMTKSGVGDALLRAGISRRASPLRYTYAGHGSDVAKIQRRGA